jgi:hypothetical protein
VRAHDIGLRYVCGGNSIIRPAMLALGNLGAEY